MMNSKESFTKNFNMIENSMEKMWDMWLVNLGSLSWIQEQMENMARKILDQNKAAREEMLKMVENVSKQTRRNQEQLQKVVEEAFTNTYEQMNYTNQEMMGEFSNKVVDMTQMGSQQKAV